MEVTDSILNSVKKLLGYEPEYTEFDPDIIMNINAAMSVLQQLGVGPEKGFSITGEDESYKDYLGEDHEDINLVNMYLFYKTKLGFDPPQNSYLVDLLEKQIKETEWRLNAWNEVKDPVTEE